MTNITEGEKTKEPPPSLRGCNSKSVSSWAIRINLTLEEKCGPVAPGGGCTARSYAAHRWRPNRSEPVIETAKRWGKYEDFEI